MKKKKLTIKEIKEINELNKEFVKGWKFWEYVFSEKRKYYK